MTLFLSNQLSHLAKSDQTFDYFMQLQGEVFREVKERCTQRIALQGQAYFIKQHRGVGWKEIFKNLLQGRLPILSAKNEWQAISRLQSLNVSVPAIVAYGCRGRNPAALTSFLVTEALVDTISLEDFCRDWAVKPPLFSVKLKLINEVARNARIMHENGINHRDFYICHFLLDLNVDSRLYLIDLHRAQIRKKIPLRWQIKDLAGLYFSVKNIGLTQRDLLRFIKAYRAKPLHDVMKNETLFWDKIKQRGEKLYQKHE